MNPKIVRLQSKLERRFKAGHPWLYSNEIQGSPKGIEPGAEVIVQDAGGAFVARGYGHPGSLICVRALSRRADEEDALTATGIERRLRRAASLRKRLGGVEASYRWVHGEADGLPGLVVDRYEIEGAGTVVVVQAHTAGIDRRLDLIVQAITAIEPEAIVIARDDVGVRALEGLAVGETPRVLASPIRRDAGALEGLLSQASVRVSKERKLRADLWAGQKTGLFLDQRANAERLTEWVVRTARASGAREVRILDLCVYVGQWASALSAGLRAARVEPRVWMVDASARALELAELNVTQAGAQAPQCVRADALSAELEAQDLLPGAGPGSFDVVICDPPALIKGRKDLAVGSQAYTQLNTRALRWLKPEGGWLASFSCSALFEETQFLPMLGKALRRSGQGAAWVERAQAAPDHPVVAEFEEGRYLKGWFGLTRPSAL